ncbi:hypothetical protein VM1G_11326 [Cytospora mali]|uniref:Uncharacterized protein n=1 Tax=Cytospora mali TaxID=578113 RepID=A0A194VMP5_CYTMA|nr:hypothetical protein VM1G_11326 [Valsa mali]
MFPEEVLIKQKLPVHDRRRGPEDGQDCVREDGRFPQVLRPVRILSYEVLRSSGFYRHGRPNTRHGHPASAMPDQSLPLEVHGQALGQHTHAHLSHGVGRLAPEEAAVYWRADDYDSASAPALLQMGQRGLNSAVEAFRVDALHQLEALHGCQRWRETACVPFEWKGGGRSVKNLNGLLDQLLDAGKVPDVYSNGSRFLAGFLDLPLHGIDGGLRRIRIWRKVVDEGKGVAGGFGGHNDYGSL